jgi:hypothetical protein
MARTAATINTLTSAGSAPASEVACDVVNGNVATGLHKNMWIEVTNAHATLARTITFVTPGTPGGFAIADQVTSIPALAKRRFGNFDTNVFGTELQFDGQTTDVTYAVYQIA